MTNPLLPSRLSVLNEFHAPRSLPDVKLTLQFYSHAVSQDRMAATGEMLIAILRHAADQSGLGAD